MQDLTGRQHDGMGIEAFEKSGVKTAIVLVRKRELAHELQFLVCYDCRWLARR